MGSLLDQVKRGILESPIAAIVYGVDGVGKTTFGAEVPDAIFLGPERGNKHLNVFRWPVVPKTLEDVRAALRELTAAHSLPYKALVIDSLDWLEPLFHKEVVIDHGKVSDISKIGYQKGYEVAVNKARDLALMLEELKDKHNMHIILIAHSKIKTFQDPIAVTGYDRYMLAMRDDMAGFWRQWAEAVLFINYEVNVEEGDRRGYGTGIRYMYTQERPSFHAKCRYDIPFKIPMIKGEMFKAFKDAVDKGVPKTPEELLVEINKLLVQIKEDDVIAKVKAFIEEKKTDTSALSAMRDRLIAKISGGK